MGEFATGVTVITTLDDQGEPHAMTANSFTSVCLEPPVVLVCVAHGTHTHGFLSKSGHFGVNILTSDQKEVGAYFAKRPEDRKSDVNYSYSEGDEGLPVLDHSNLFLGCQVIGSHVYGDHTIYLGEVREIRRLESKAPLMFYQSHWYNPAEE
ncbi:MAG: hypothetical protein BZY88_02620 [SAR202 cluster bacterium Io17-Chloro-G9]|nr:MAG: hypothetical protein BZY88_02620 [SAR202 cluster bacterium Io17-Chloro-G9]